MSIAASIIDVIAFPKTLQATDLMSNSPAEVSQQQLDELGICFTTKPQSHEEKKK